MCAVPLQETFPTAYGSSAFRNTVVPVGSLAKPIPSPQLRDQCCNPTRNLTAPPLPSLYFRDIVEKGYTPAGSELGLMAEEVAGTCSVGEEAEVSSLDVPSQECAVGLRARVPRMMSKGSQSSRLSYVGTLRFTV